MRSYGLPTVVACLTLISSVGKSQEIVSAESGAIHYLEGVVLVDDAPLDRKPATFPLLKNGSVLKTQKGRVELMLTPGVFLRLDENSSVKMLSNALTSTSLQFIAGSAILDALAAQGEIPVTLRFKDASVSFTKPGLYRIDSDTAVLQAYSGEALIKQDDKQTNVDPTRLYFFELGTDTRKFSDGTDDEFLDWARNRNQVIAEENQAAQAEEDDSTDADLGGLPSLNMAVPYGGSGGTLGLPQYGSIYPYDSLFYNNYALSPFWALPPLPGPILVIGRPWTYHVAHSNWPHSASWTSHYPSTVGSWPITHPLGVTPSSTYIHPAITGARSIYTHPLITPRVSTPTVHVVGHR